MTELGSGSDPVSGGTGAIRHGLGTREAAHTGEVTSPLLVKQPGKGSASEIPVLLAASSSAYGLPNTPLWAAAGVPCGRYGPCLTSPTPEVNPAPLLAWRTQDQPQDGRAEWPHTTPPEVQPSWPPVEEALWPTALRYPDFGLSCTACLKASV